MPLVTQVTWSQCSPIFASTVMRSGEDIRVTAAGSVWLFAVRALLRDASMPGSPSLTTATASSSSADAESSSDFYTILTSLVALFAVVIFWSTVKRWSSERIKRRADGEAEDMRKRPRVFSAAECVHKNTHTITR